jgi:hypothetical protein
MLGGCSSGYSSENRESCENGCPGFGPGEDGAEASFTGPTYYASIDQNNVQSLAGGAYVAGQFSRAMADQSAEQDLQDIKADNLRTLRLPLVLSTSARSIDLSFPDYGSRQAYKDVRTKTGAEYGNCGGKFEYFIDINDATHEFNGSHTYSKYCDQGFAVSGKADVEGTWGHTGQIRTIDFSFSDLFDDQVIMEGDISIEYTDTRVECYLDFYAEDQGTGNVYWIDQYILSIYELSDYIEFELYGSYHDPDYGPVLVDTSANFQIDNDNKWPSSGSLLIQGQDNVTAELIAVDSTNCMIRADLNGDGVIDFESEVLKWENLTGNFDQL